MSIVRINHVPQIIKKRGMTRSQFIKEAQYHADISWPTAAKIADGETDIQLDTLERLAAWLGLSKDDILESRKT